MARLTLCLALLTAAIGGTHAIRPSPDTLLFEDYKGTPNPCDIGPSYWCQDADKLAFCLQSDAYANIRAGGHGINISPQGFGTTPSPELTMETFCNTYSTALTYQGGIAGAPTGSFGYFALALYWAPSSCEATCTPPSCNGFCSPYTVKGSYAETHMVVHGLWPDYGSIYNDSNAPQPPTFPGSYTPWPQWCKGPEIDAYTKCNVNGAKTYCPLPAAQFPNFTQSEHEACIRQFNITDCQVGNDTLEALGSQFELYAPGYLGSNYTFLDHEFFKHGSCYGGELSANKTFFFETVLRMYHDATAKGSVTDRLINSNAGKSVTNTTLYNQFQQKAVPMCNNDCTLYQIYYCYARSASGLPASAVTCPLGTQENYSCGNCPKILLPTYSSSGR